MKRLLQTLLFVALTAVLTPSLFAQPPGGRGGPPEGGPRGQGGPGQAVLQALDIDGNHEISATEIANASAALNSLDSNGDGKLSEEDNANGRGGRNGQQGRGNRQNNNQQGQGRGGPPGGGQGGQGGPDPDRFVTHAMEFDADGDGKLNETELLAFAQQMGPPHGQGEGNGARQGRPQR